MTATPYRLYGASHSLYTGKVRCYLRNQGIDYVEVPPGTLILPSASCRKSAAESSRYWKRLKGR